MCLYVYIHMYTYSHRSLYISEMNDSDDTRDRRKQLELFCYYKVLTLSGLVLVQSGLRVVANIIANFMETTKNIADLLKKKKNHIRCLIKTTRGRNCGRQKDE